MFFHHIYLSNKSLEQHLQCLRHRRRQQRFFFFFCFRRGDFRLCFFGGAGTETGTGTCDEIGGGIGRGYGHEIGGAVVVVVVVVVVAV